MISSLLHVPMRPRIGVADVAGNDNLCVAGTVLPPMTA